MTNKCGIEKVLKNVSYTETVCDNKSQDICELEFVGGESRPVSGSCVSKPVEECREVTRFQEEFVDQDICRDIPIKDCKNEQEEICNEKQEEVCEVLETENCEIVPHEECQQVVEKIPTKISKKVTKVVCAEDEETDNEETENPESEDNNNDKNILNDIFEIFGISSNNNENEVADRTEVKTTTELMIDDGLLAETTLKTPTRSTTTTSTSTTAGTTLKTTTKSTTNPTTITTTTELITSTVTPDSSTQAIANGGERMDGSKIIFSDDELEARNKDLANRVYVGHIPSKSASTESTPNRNTDPHSRIFFPE